MLALYLICGVADMIYELFMGLYNMLTFGIEMVA